eukprot:jgi/Mesvir1/27445/Mv26386-RA.1
MLPRHHVGQLTVFGQAMAFAIALAATTLGNCRPGCTDPTPQGCPNVLSVGN